MVSKKYNRRIVSVILYTVGFVIISVSICLLAVALSCAAWKMVGAAMLVSAIGLTVLQGAVNKSDDITIDYANKEVLSNIKLDKRENICVPFDSIVDVYICDSEQMRKEVKRRKYPPKALVIVQSWNKVYISLKHFDEKTVNALLEDLRKVRDGYE